MPVLETENLIIRDLIIEDMDLFHNMSIDEKITKYQKWFLGENGYKQWVEESIEHNKRIPRFAYNMAIIHKNIDKKVGWIGWGTNDLEKREYDFGYSLLSEYWGKGIMTEALKRAINYMLDELKANFIFGECVCENYASARVMEKAGLMLIKEWDEKNKTTDKIEKRRKYGMSLFG